MHLKSTINDRFRFPEIWCTDYVKKVESSVSPSASSLSETARGLESGDKNDTNNFLLHYRSPRGGGLKSLVVGIVRDVAHVYFNSLVQFELLEYQGEHEAAATVWHVQSTPQQSAGDQASAKRQKQCNYAKTMRSTRPSRCPFSGVDIPVHRDRTTSSTTDGSSVSMGLTGTEMGIVFPYFVRFDESLTITEVGPQLQERCSMTVVGSQLSSVFQLCCPAGSSWNWSDLCRCLDSTFEVLLTKPLDAAAPPLKFIGGLYMFGSTSLSPTGSVGTLLVSPEVSTVKDMADQGFSWGTDIPVHSAQRRLIMMNEHLRSETTLNNLAQLESARRKQSLEMKRLFVRYVSHEIRTPLSTVTIGLDLIRKLANGGPVTVEKDGGADVSDADETDQMKMATISSIANDAEESCQVAVSILNDLLLYEKIEGEILALERSKNPAVELIMDIARQFSIQSKAQRVELAFTYDLSCFRADELEKPSVFVLVDRPKMSQVLRNLLSNAFKFSSAGSIVKVHMSVRDKMASGPSTSSLSAEVPQVFSLRSPVQRTLGNRC